MTKRQQKKIAYTLKRVAKTEFGDAFRATTRREDMMRLAAQAQKMGLQPDVLLTPEGRDAFAAIARAIATQPRCPAKPLRAEWALIIERVERFFSTSPTPVRVAS